MIHRIRIRNWRSYRDATVNLDHPVVFFVAPNGVGKTSLFDAARFCLLGLPTGRGAARSVRTGTDRAEISMELTVGEDLITISRTLTASGRVTFSAARESGDLNEQGFIELLNASWATDAALLDRLLFGDTGRRSPLPVREHLADLLGVTPMLNAATALRAAAKLAHNNVAGLRQDLSVSAGAVATAETTLASANAAVQEVASQQEALKPRVIAAQRDAQMAAAWDTYRVSASAYAVQVQELTTEIANIVAIEAAPLAQALDVARSSAEHAAAQAREAATEADRERVRATTASQLLRESIDTCPTCLRPLSNDERQTALRGHEDTVETDGSRYDDATTALARAEERLQAVATLTRRLDRIQPPAMPDDEDPGAAAATQLEGLRSLEATLAERQGEARAHRDAAAATLKQAQSDVAGVARLTIAAREELMFETTAATLGTVADRYLTERIEPLALEVAHRWKLLFGTEGLVLQPNGEIRLQHDELDLSLDEMSGGERAVAGILTRILVAGAATRIPTVWFDEPLEHLDPRRRSTVAHTLVSAVAASTVNQVVVTTYEESIARRLALAAPELVSVVVADIDNVADPESSIE